MWQGNFFYFLTTIVLVVIPPQSVLVELLYLFFQCHSADQVIYTLLNGSFGIFVDGLHFCLQPLLRPGNHLKGGN